MTFRIAHISDIHFSKVSFSPMQFFSKQIIGNLNLIIRRRKIHLNSRATVIPKFFKELNITHVIVTGDLTTTSSHQEYQIAKRFIEQLENLGIQVFSLPGNHDHYTKRSFCKKKFFRYFPEKQNLLFTMQKNSVSLTKLSENLYLVMLDTTMRSPIYLSNGRFSENTELELAKVLTSLPKKANIILANHFPLFQNEHPRRVLLRAQALQKLVKQHSNISFYLHGHTHRHCFADLRSSGFPIVLDSGSLSHHVRGSFNLLEIDRQKFTVKSCHFQHNLTPYPWKTVEHGKFEG